jgi:hypothetical protein
VIEAGRLGRVYVAALALGAAALTAPWAIYRSRGITVLESGWAYEPGAIFLLLLLGLSWPRLGPAGRRLRRDAAWLAVLLLGGQLEFYRRELYATWPQLTGNGVTVLLWIAVAAFVAAAIAATLLARGPAPAVARVPRPATPAAPWRVVAPLLVAPFVLLVSYVFFWSVPDLWNVVITLSALLGLWASLIRAAVPPEPLGTRVARELGRLVALVAGVDVVFGFLLDPRRYSLANRGVASLVLEAFVAVLALVGSRALADGGYRWLHVADIPEILRVDRIAPPGGEDP